MKKHFAWLASLLALSLSTQPVLCQSQNSTQFMTQTISFEDQELAFEVLSQLDAFEPIDDSHFKSSPSQQPELNNVGLKNEESYCHIHRAMFIEDPDSTLYEMPYVTYTTSKMHQVTNVKIGRHDKRSTEVNSNFDIPFDAQIFFTKKAPVKEQEVGKHIACLSQAVSFIPGDFTLNRKDIVAESATEYAKNYTTRLQCINSDKFFPQTWTLYDEDSCNEFFKILKSPEYARKKQENKVVFIKKVGFGKGAHGGKGVVPLTDDEEAALKETYLDGSLCGKITQNLIVQHFVHNPLLINGRKFDFRMYMLVASTNPLMAYYHDGFLRVSRVEYDTTSSDRRVYMNNLGPQQWSFDDLLKYLLKEEVVNDPNWLDNYLRPEFKRAMIHLLRMSSHTFLNRSSVYALYGVDFMLDENLNLWFIEANAGRSFSAKTDYIDRLIQHMLEDHIEIVSGLLKSRMKRAVVYVNEVINRGSATTTEGSVVIKELGSKIAEFKSITTNYFEKEYQPRPSNGFSKIVDEHYDGVERYQGLLSQDCL